MAGSQRERPPRGRERGPRYIRTIAGIQFVIEPYWRVAERGGGFAKVRSETSAPLVKDGYLVTSGLPPTWARGREGRPHFETLALAKRRCEEYAAEHGLADNSGGDGR